MRRGFPVFLLILLFAGMGVYGQSSRKYIKAGEEFIRNNMFDDAIDQFSHAIEESPASADGYVKRARVYELTGNYRLAYDDYKRALNFMPDDTGILYNLGHTCNMIASGEKTTAEEQKKYYSEAVSVLQKAIKAEFRNGRLYTEKVVSL